jgi:uncharacterized protein
MLFCFFLMLIFFGHFCLVLFSHNWFYSRPFSRITGDLIQVAHFLIGLIGLFVVYESTIKFNSFICNTSSFSVIDIELIYALVCFFVVFVVFPINEFLRNYWVLPRSLYFQSSQLFDYSVGIEDKRFLAPIDDSFKLELVNAEISTKFLTGNSRFKILHISDFHLGGNDNFSYFNSVLSEIQNEVFDVVFFTGDLVDSTPALRWIVPLFKKINAKHGKYAVLGNHDLWNEPDMVRKYLAKAGFVCLLNRWVSFDFEGSKIGVFGVGYPWFCKKLPEIQLGDYDAKILLSHSPDEFFWAGRNDFDLMFCGHVHGGQISLPFFGPLVIPSKYGRWFGNGFYKCERTSNRNKLNGMIMHVSRGLAGSVPFRVNCKPEITILDLVPEARIGKK